MVVRGTPPPSPSASAAEAPWSPASTESKASPRRAKKRGSIKIEEQLANVKTLGPVPLLGVLDADGKQAWAEGAATQVVELWKKKGSGEAVRDRLRRRMNVIARDKSSAHATEFTGLIQAKTISFHRRLERGAGAELYYEKHGDRCGSRASGATPHAALVGGDPFKKAPVIIHAGGGLVWWRGHEMGVVRHRRMRGLAQCFALSDVLGAAPLEDDETGRAFALTLARPVSVVAPYFGVNAFPEDARLETFDLVFTTRTRGTTAHLCAGFDLLRKHHKQLFDETEGDHRVSSGPPGDGETDGGTDVESGRGSASRRMSRMPTASRLTGSVKAPSAGTARFTAAEPLGSVEGSGPTFADRVARRLSLTSSASDATRAARPKAAAIAPSAWSAAAAIFEPRRDVGYQHYEQDIAAKVVEVQYNAFAPGAGGKVRLPDGAYFPVPTEHFCEGTWLVCTVDPEGFDETQNTYTLEYKDGPFEKVGEEQGMGVGVTIKIAQFPDGTTFEDVPREEIQVDIWDQPTAGFPWFIVATTAVQVLIYALYMAGVVDHDESYGGPEALTLDAMSGWPSCDDQRSEVWRYIGYQFVHASHSHIAFNAIVQLMIGIPLELASGARLGVVYETGVVVGALAVMFSDPTDTVVGASGGVYALFGAHFGHTVLNFHELRRGFFNRYTRFFLLTAFIAVDTGMAVATLSKEGNEASTSYAAHAGGFVAGLGFAFFGFEELVDHHGKTHKLRPVAALLMVALVVFLVANVAAMDPIRGIHTPAREDVYCCYQTAYCSGLDKSDNDKFSCSLDDGDYVVYPRNQRAPNQETLSCDALIDFANPARRY